MNPRLVLDDDQHLLQSAARDLARAHAPLDALRQRRDIGDDDGFDPALWRRLAELGWTGITLPESCGGAGGRLADLAVVLEELGRTLTPTPYLSTVLLAGGLLRDCGASDQWSEYLSQIAAGELLLAVGLQDGQQHTLRATTTATASDIGWSLTGTKRLVLDGHLAERLIVLASLAGTTDLGLFLVDPGDDRVRVGMRRTVDHRIVADVTLDGVRVDRRDVIEAPASAEVIERVVDAATAGLCAEMLGGTAAIFELTIQYLKDRVQFDVPIGSFQALQHRVAMLHCDIELARALVMEAVGAVDDRRPDRALVVSAAKATMSDLFRRTSAEAIQLHGGMGMTDEAAPGLYVKRARVTNALLGDATFHRRRFAEQSGWLADPKASIGRGRPSS